MAVISLLTHHLVEELEAAEEQFDRLMGLVGLENQEKTLLVLTGAAVQLVNQIVFDSSSDALWIALPVLASAHLPFIHFQVSKEWQQRASRRKRLRAISARCCLFPKDSQFKVKLVLTIEH